MLTVAKSLLPIWKEHSLLWSDCRQCPSQIGHHANQHVIARGTLPCEVLFIGEAPGKVEDAKGYPFVGPAGKLLDQLIQDTRSQFSYAITNVIACIPRDTGGNTREPSGEEAGFCSVRLRAFVHLLAKPLVVVCLGKVAQRYASDFFQDSFPLKHPAYLLRVGGVGSAEYKRTLAELVEIVTSGLESARHGLEEKEA